VTADELWNEGAAALRNQLAPATWAAWFHGVTPLSHGDGTLVLSVPSSLAAERIRSSYAGMLTDAIRDRTGETVQIDLVVETTPRETVVEAQPELTIADERTLITDGLVTTGLFRRVRHPMYVGFALWIVGWSAYQGAVLSLAIGSLGLI